MNETGFGLDRLKRICNEFDVASVETAQPFGSGHINNTFLVKCADESREYILQQINHNVFKNPFEVMENIIMVTDHLRKKFAAMGQDTDRKCLKLFLTKTGAPCYVDHDGTYWRMTLNIQQVYAVDRVDDPMQMYHAGKAFGEFVNMLSDFDASKLHETIVDFHNTPKRLAGFLQTVENDTYNRCAQVKAEIDFILERQADCSLLFDMHKAGELPLRATHNDTKINNVLFDVETGQDVCVIDLDTLMPGILAYDFGDSMRSGANTADEDEPDTSKVSFDVERFKYYTKGYLETNSNITQNERDVLAFSAKLLCLEQGIRFLDDYLNNDTYYKISRPGQNLDRARTQLKLVADIEENMAKMQEIVRNESGRA